MDETAVKVENVSKKFRLPHEKQSSLKSIFVNSFRRKKGYEIQSALNDISFEVKKGEFFGIIGKNGSGKSTLLKLLAEIYVPSNGAITVNGKLTPFIELGVGFNPELTGRENVYLNGALLGFSRKEMQAMYKDIVSFAELERFMDQKLKNYSSGMQVRLAFSIAIRAESDILLIDEVLAVGDANFQNKCIKVFEELKREGRSIVFISHDMSMIRRFCDRVLMIKNGEIVSEGTANEVAEQYEIANLPEDQSISVINQNIQNRENKVITKMSLTSRDKKVRKVFLPNEELTLSIELKPDTKVKNLGVAVYSKDGGYVFGTNTIIDKFPISQKVSYSFDAPAGSGTYYLKIGAFGETDREIYEFFDNGPIFNVSTPRKDASTWGGITPLKHRWHNLK